MEAVKWCPETVLALLMNGPMTITEIVGGSMSYAARKPVRAAIEALLADRRIRRIGLGKSRAFVAVDWRVTDVWLRAHIESKCVREGGHMLWAGNWDQYRRGVIQVDGRRYDVRRELWRMKTGHQLRTSSSVTSRCEHEKCMTHLRQTTRAGEPGHKHNLATRKKLAEQKRSRSKYGPELIALVKASDKSHKQIARETGVALSTVGAIRSGRLWRDFSNPWAGLIG